MLAAWREQRERWARLRQRLSAQSGTPEAALAFQRGDAARRRHEAVAALEGATTLEEQLGPLAWALSLRDNWELALPIGHPLYSGLTAHRRLDLAAAAAQDTVRREPGEASLAPTARGRRTAAALQAAAGVSDDDVAGLEVVGVALETHARALVARRVDGACVLRRACVSEEGSRLLSDDAAAALAAAKKTLLAPPAPPLPPPPLTPGPAAVAAPALLRVGPSGVATSQLRNTGSCCLHYRWERTDCTAKAGPAGFAPRPFPGLRPGCLLPGETRAIAFELDGVPSASFAELWQLVTMPPLPPAAAVELLLSHTVVPDPAAPPATPPATVPNTPRPRSSAAAVQLASAALAFERRLAVLATRPGSAQV